MKAICPTATARVLNTNKPIVGGLYKHKTVIDKEKLWKKTGVVPQKEMHFLLDSLPLPKNDMRPVYIDKDTAVTSHGDVTFKFKKFSINDHLLALDREPIEYFYTENDIVLPGRPFARGYRFLHCNKIIIISRADFQNFSLIKNPY